MNFSYEEIYSMYGQYDTFVTLAFHYDSESYKLYKPTLMGVFIYNLEERNELQQLIQTDNIPRSVKYIRFYPSPLENLSSKQVEELDRNGILNSDIASVSTFDMPRVNRFISIGEKDIPNTIEIKIDSSKMDLDKLKLSFYKSRLRDNYKLIPEEENEYYGLQLLYNPSLINDEIKNYITDKTTGKIKEPIRFYQLKAKFFLTDLTKEEENEFKTLIRKRNMIKNKILINEFKQSTEKIKELVVNYKDPLSELFDICYQFEDELLVPFKNPIWWDFERFIHIYIRHVKETKIGERFETRTIFLYKFENIRRIIKAVIEKVHEEIEIHFKESPGKTFRRMGTRSIYFDGVYYRVEIEATGRLLTFHPCNDNTKLIYTSTI